MNPDPTSLDRLHDLVAPPPVPSWPPAPGWYWLLGFASVALIIVVARAIRHRRSNLYRREALALLTPTLTLTALPDLVKRTALSAYPRETVAALTGDAWLAFLDRTAETTDFTEGAGRQLVALAYEPELAVKRGESERAELIAVLRKWITNHRVEDD